MKQLLNISLLLGVGEVLVVARGDRYGDWGDGLRSCPYNTITNSKSKIISEALDNHKVTPKIRADS